MSEGVTVCDPCCPPDGSIDACCDGQLLKLTVDRDSLINLALISHNKKTAGLFTFFPKHIETASRLFSLLTPHCREPHVK